jgi:hypothetical protein
MAGAILITGVVKNHSSYHLAGMELFRICIGGQLYLIKSPHHYSGYFLCWCYNKLSAFFSILERFDYDSSHFSVFAFCWISI